MKTKPLTKSRAQEHLPREEDVRAHDTDTLTEHTHTSVMVEEVLELLAIQPNDVVLDATAGLGGHSFEILSRTLGTVLALDADAQAVKETRARLEKFGDRVEVAEGNFSTTEKILKKYEVPRLNKALFDLGWNSTQLLSGRGFSFLHDEPLNMSYGLHPESGFTAQEILAEWDEKTLADVFYGYGEEQYSRGIAKAIVERRKVKQLETTLELSELVRDSVPAGYRHGRIHPATKTFQALRIAVNDELGVIEKGVLGAWAHLEPQGRIAVITFHSIEDRVVKRLFQTLVKSDEGQLVNKKTLVPSRKEVLANPRARSAKLRVIEKK